MNRSERRRRLRNETKEGKWEKRISPKDAKQGTGWFGEMDRAYCNGKYAAMVRTIETKWGKVEHVCIRNIASTDISWSEKQKIKNELFGAERIAIEVFPKDSELVDEANMYHLWVFSEEFNLPFGI